MEPIEAFSVTIWLSTENYWEFNFKTPPVIPDVGEVFRADVGPPLQGRHEFRVVNRLITFFDVPRTLEVLVKEATGLDDEDVFEEVNTHQRAVDYRLEVEMAHPETVDDILSRYGPTEPVD